MSVTLEQLREEHASHVIGPELANLLARVATATAKTYPPEYSPSGTWNDQSIEDVLHDWTEDRLLRRRDLSKMLAGATHVDGLRAALTTSFGQHLTNRRRRSSAVNLYKRMVKLLRTKSGFVAFGEGRASGETPWTLADTPSSEMSPMSEDDLVRLSFEVSDEELGVVHYGPHSVRESPILREPALERFLVHMLKGAGGGLSAQTLIEVMKRRFNLVEAVDVELDEAAEAEIVEAGIDQRVAALAVAAQLGARRSEMVMAVAKQGNLDDAATAMGVEPSALERGLSEAVALVAEFASDAAEASTIYELVVETLFGESG